MTTSARRGLFAQPLLLLAGASAYTMSTLFSALKPVLLTRFVEEAGFGEALAGLLVAMPFVGIACAAFLMNPLVTRFSIRQLIFIFGSALITGELISAYTFAIPSITLALQFVCGFSVGVLMGATSKVIATRPSPGPIFGFVDMVAVLAMSFMIFGAGLAVGESGLRGGYVYAAITALLLTLAMLAYRPAVANDKTSSQMIAPLKLSLAAIAVVAMAVLFVTASGLGFAFMFTIALSLDMTYESAGSFIGALLFVSAAGCLAGGWAAAKFGPIRPLAAAYVCCAIGWYVAIHATTPVVFMCALVPAIFALQFNYPILLTLSGSLDAEGRWAAIATPLQASGFAWAAIAAGALVSQFGVEVLGIATVIGMALCLALLAVARTQSAAS